MAHKQAAFKAIRQTAKRTVRNRNRKRVVKELTKKSLEAIKAKEKSALDQVRAASKAIDKAVQKGTLHPNTGARQKSRLMKRLNG
jgi:small subunit ribosomal protein S20